MKIDQLKFDGYDDEEIFLYRLKFDGYDDRNMKERLSFNLKIL